MTTPFAEGHDVPPSALDYDPHLLDVMRDVACEVIHARERYDKFNSAHEGYAVLLEEVRELEAEVFKSPKRREYGEMYTEAKQVAAMAVRFMLDVDKKGCVK